MNKNKTIPVFFACDENFVKFTAVTIKSLIANASKEFSYDIHILCTKISEEKKRKAQELASEGFKIYFDDVTDYLKSIS